MTHQFRVRIVNVRPKRGDNTPFETGEFSFKDGVLDKLPRYFKYVDLMRKVDPDAYALFSRIGASVLPSEKVIIAVDCDVAGKYYEARDIPAFGCVYLHKDDDPSVDRIGADFMWWTKLNPGPLIGVEAAEGEIYCVTALYHDEDKLAQPVTFHVAVPSIAGARVLKEYTTHVNNMYDHKSQVDRRSYAIPRREWSYPSGLRMVSIDNQKAKPADVGRHIFAIAITAVMSRRRGFQVRVAHAGRYAVFNIDDHAAPKFFADREVQVNENGRAKRIFHFVPGYQKTNGKFVAGHTKGLREFDWNGYSVHIGKPDFDFHNPDGLTAPADIVADDAPIDRGRHLTMSEVGVLVQRHIRQSAMRRRGGKKRVRR